MRDGAWLQDPYYDGESSWYNPLLASGIAAISYLTGQPVHVVATRAGAYWNVAAPATFYLLVCRLFGPPTALLSLVGFVFLVRGPTWATPTYSPWLFASVFAQPFFYLTLTAYYGAIAGGRRWRYVVTGLLLGVTFLAHTAPAMIALVCILAVAGYRCGVEKHGAREALGELTLIAGPAILLAVPFLSTIVGRYRLRISNPIPLMWRDPGLPTDLMPLVSTVVGWRGALATAIVLALAALALRRTSRSAAVIVTAGFAASVGFFLYSQCFITDDAGRIAWPPIVPAHHFLVYVRALEMVLFGAAVSSASLGIAWMTRRAIRLRSNLSVESIAHVLQAVIVVAIASSGARGFLARDAFTTERQAAMRGFTAEEPKALVAWLRENSGPADVFLTSESACVSMVAPSGRKCILAPRFFSSPYVDWNARSDTHHAMWNALVAGDCATFTRHANERRLRFVMTVASRTPQVSAGQCGLVPMSFQGSSWRVYSVVGSR
jgi:hypothetical protein